MYYLQEVFPFLRRFRGLPVTRDQVMLLMVAVNELFLGLDHYLAHLISGTIRTYEMIPIMFGPIAGILLIILGVMALRWRTLASTIATLILAAGIIVGLTGWYLHFIRAALPWAPVGHRMSVELLIWAPPFLGPLTASLVGLVGILSLWKEEPVDSGNLSAGKFKVPIFFSKSRVYFFLVGLGVLATLISSVLDHSRTDFSNPWLWVPLAGGIFGTVVGIFLGAVERPSRGDLITFTFAMFLLIAIGVVGFGLHAWNDYLLGLKQIVPERFLRGAPFMAPLLFADMGTLGLVVLLDYRERRK